MPRSHREVALPGISKVVERQGSNHALKHHPDFRTKTAKSLFPFQGRRLYHNGHCLAPWPLLRVQRTRNNTDRLQAVNRHSVRLAPAKCRRCWMPPEYRIIPQCSNTNHRAAETRRISPQPQHMRHSPTCHDPRPSHPPSPYQTFHCHRRSQYRRQWECRDVV